MTSIAEMLSDTAGSRAVVVGVGVDVEQPGRRKRLSDLIDRGQIDTLRDIWHRHQEHLATRLIPT